MKKFISSLIAAGALAVSAQAHAVVFDFAGIADGADYGDLSASKYADGSGVVSDVGEAAFNKLVWTVGGITLTATGSLDDGSKAWAYLDEKSGGKPAGLGVCSQGVDADNECVPSSDDNVTFGEILTIAFDQTVTVDLGDSLFRDANHDLQVFDFAQISIDGGAWMNLFGGEVFTADTFSLRINKSKGGEQFYLDALSVDVPEPATLALMGLGLAGLGAVRRKKA